VGTNVSTVKYTTSLIGKRKCETSVEKLKKSEYGNKIMESVRNMTAM
jgi:hypothetical protein